MRPPPKHVPAAGVLGVLLGVAAPATAESRPYIFGCGITWGRWLGLPDPDAREFDRRSMDRIVQMGGTNCPANFAWGDIERTRGVYDWSYVDHQVDEALARGLTVFAYSGLTPDWALPPGILDQYGSGIGYRFPPDEQYIPDFENFFRALAARYRGRVIYYEFWNEPNGCSWINDGCANGHMAHTYVPWLIRWYEAMKQGDPDCVLAVGGLDYGEHVTQGAQYIEDIYVHGGGNHFDAVAIHPYGRPLHWQAIHDTYAVLTSRGHGHKSLWLNEYGWNTSDENLKAANVTTVLTELKKPEYHMVFMANHLVITDLPETPDNGHDYGLCGRNRQTLTLTPRQSWYAFQAVDKTFPIRADFAADVTSGPLPLTVRFTDLSDYPDATGWSWIFGDGQTSSQQNPVHTYTADGRYTVRLTVTGPRGTAVRQKTDYIEAGVPPPRPGVDNPSFEEASGSLNGWEIVVVQYQGPDNPPLDNGNPWGVTTPAGTHFAGKITSGMRMDFCLGQVVGTQAWHPSNGAVRWQLSALTQMHCSHENQPRPAGVQQVWEIGWMNDGSEPADIMSCDRYVTAASLDATYTGNALAAFLPVGAGGQISAVTGLRGLALRVRFTNSAAWWWTFNNIDNVAFTVTGLDRPVPGDFDGDTDVDPVDLQRFLSCRTAPGVPQPDALCREADLDRDEDVDSADFGILQRCLTGTGIPASPDC